MGKIIEIFNRIAYNVLSALYQPFWAAILLAFLAMFLYLYGREHGWKKNNFIRNMFETWWSSFKSSSNFRRTFLLAFYTAMILLRTVLNREIWFDPLGKLLGGWGLYDEDGQFTTKSIENFMLFVPFSILLLWAFQQELFGESKSIGFGKTVWKVTKVVAVFSFMIEFTQLLFHLGTFQISDLTYNLYVIEPTVHGDDRGYFMETYNLNDMKEAGLDMNFVQDNQSMSTKGVLRGLHFQKQYPQGKLVRAIKGRVFDVAVDLRFDSKTYGQWYGVELTEENKKQFYISEGFAHGFLVLSDTAEFCYKCTDFYHPGDEGGLAWNDPEIGIEWPELVGEYNGTASAEGYALKDGTKLNLSEKDQKWVGMKDAFKF